MFRRAIPKATKEQQERQDICRALGCLACHIDGKNLVCGPTEIHHITRSGRQIGQDETIALGAWHHRGILLPGFRTSSMTSVFGPSLAKGSRTFHAHYGSDDRLLELQNERLGVRKAA